MGVSDADPTAGAPNQGAPSSADPTASQESPEVQALRAQLEEQKQQIRDLTGQAQQQQQEQGGASNELLQQLVAAQSEYRKEIADLRSEIAKSRGPLPATTSRALSAEELLANRMAEVNAHPYYCPGCGKLYNYLRECVGSGEKPHPAVEVVSTDELKNPPDPSDKAAVAEYQSKHTPQQYVDPQTNRRLLAA